MILDVIFVYDTLAQVSFLSFIDTFDPSLLPGLLAHLQS